MRRPCVGKCSSCAEAVDKSTDFFSGLQLIARSQHDTPSNKVSLLQAIIANSRGYILVYESGVASTALPVIFPASLERVPATAQRAALVPYLTSAKTPLDNMNMAGSAANTKANLLVKKWQVPSPLQ